MKSIELLKSDMKLGRQTSINDYSSHEFSTTVLTSVCARAQQDDEINQITNYSRKYYFEKFHLYCHPHFKTSLFNQAKPIILL